MEYRRNDRQGMTNALREKKNCPSLTFPTTNVIWIGQGPIPGIHGEKAATNCLSHGIACEYVQTLVHVSFPQVTTTLVKNPKCLTKRLTGKG